MEKSFLIFVSVAFIIVLIYILIHLVIGILFSIFIVCLHILVFSLQVFLTAIVVALSVLLLTIIPLVVFWTLKNIVKEINEQNINLHNYILAALSTMIIGLSLGYLFMHPLVTASEHWLKQPLQQITTQSDTKWKFPMPECGDKDIEGKQRFYPVFVNSINVKTLDYIRQEYCHNASIQLKALSENQAIQVASFHNKTTAFDFAKIMIEDPQIGSGEVGEPILK